MLANEIVFLSVSELSELIRDLKISPVELTKAYIERINALDFKLNSFITVFRTTALNEARIAEEEIKNGRYLGPLHGIPVAVKDQFWTKGVRTTAGSRIQQEFIPNDNNVISATTDYSTKIVCSAEKENLFGTQFHPEKSQRNGLKLLRNFAKICVGSD